MMRLPYRLYLAVWAFKNWKTLQLIQQELIRDARCKNSNGRDTAISYAANRWAGMLSF